MMAMMMMMIRWDSPLIIITPHLDDLQSSSSSTNSNSEDREMSTAELALLMKQLDAGDNNNNINADNTDNHTVNNEDSTSPFEYKYLDEDTLAAIDSAIFQGKTLTPNISSLPVRCY